MGNQGDMSRTQPVMGHVLVVVILILTGLWWELPRARATDAVFTGEGGGTLWSDADNWSTSTFPHNNGDTFNVIIDGDAGRDSSVSLINIPATVDGLTITAGDDLLISERALTVVGRMVTNDNALTVDTGRLRLFASSGASTIMNTGEVVLLDGVIDYSGSLQFGGSGSVRLSDFAGRPTIQALNAGDKLINS